MMVLVVLVLFAGTAVFVRYMLRQGSLRDNADAADTSPNAEAILRKRFARGELDRDEFYGMMEDLRMQKKPD